MRNPRLALVVLRSNDIASTKIFYENLGLNFKEEKHGNGPIHYSATLGETTVEIYPQSDNIYHTIRLGFYVDNLDNVLDNLSACGIEIISKAQITKHGYKARVRDHDGRVIELYQWQNGVIPKSIDA